MKWEERERDDEGREIESKKDGKREERQEGKKLSNVRLGEHGEGKI